MLKLWRYSISRLKTSFKNYNVIERAEKVMEIEKRAAPPRHPGTEVKFQVLVKGNPGLKEEMKKKDQELLNRLKIVKVDAKTAEEGTETGSRPLPQERKHLPLPMFGYEEPNVIPEGRCTLKQALEFLAKHQNDPQTHSIEAIAKNYSMQTKDVQKIVDHFRAFELFISRESNQNVEQDVLDNLAIAKVVKPMFRAKFSNLSGNVTDGKDVVDEKKKL